MSGVSADFSWHHLAAAQPAVESESSDSTWAEQLRRQGQFVTDAHEDEVEWYTGFLPPAPGEEHQLRAAMKRELGPRYRVERFVGRGAFATVWQAFDEVADEWVALKRFHGGLRESSNFYRELRALFRLSHPRLVRLINLMEPPDGARYLIFEFCSGGSLRPAISKARNHNQPWPESRVLQLAMQMAEGLHVAHREGLIHRDLKPENVLFTTPATGFFADSADVKLADFGLATAFRPAREPPGLAADQTLSGSPAYMAPEQFIGQFSESSDLYALGIILFELLHGRPPFLGSPEELARQHLNRPIAPDENLNKPWKTLLHDLLAKSPDDRLTSAAELLVQLEQLQPRSATIPHGKPAAARSTKQPCFRHLAGMRPRGLLSFTTTAGQQLITPNAAGIVGWDARTGTQHRFYDLPNCRGAWISPAGHCWAFTDHTISQIDADWNATTWDCDLPNHAAIEALTVVRGPQRSSATVVADDCLAAFELSDDNSSQARRLWSCPIRRPGLRPALLDLPDGRLICCEGPAQPRLLLFSTDRRDIRACPLPGPCWQLLAVPEPSGSGFHILGKIQSDDHFELWSSQDLSHWEPIRDLGPVAYLAQHPNPSTEHHPHPLTVISPAGDVSTLGPDLQPHRRFRCELPMTAAPALVKGLAVADQRVVVVSREERTFWISGFDTGS